MNRSTPCHLGYNQSTQYLRYITHPPRRVSVTLKRKTLPNSLVKVDQAKLPMAIELLTGEDRRNKKAGDQEMRRQTRSLAVPQAVAAVRRVSVNEGRFIIGGVSVVEEINTRRCTTQLSSLNMGSLLIL